MTEVIGYFAVLGSALVTPINCVGNLGADVLNAIGNFAGCVGGNIVNITSSATNLPII